MTYKNPQALVGTDWLAEHLNDEDVKIVDATWFLPTMGRDAEIEYELRHIPGAIRFDIDAIATEIDDLPHMMPSPAKFAKEVGKLGISRQDKVICYDALGGFCAAARVWWMFRAFGHDHVAVLDGGLPKWMAEKRPIDKGVVEPIPTHYEEAPLKEVLIRRYDDILKNIDSKEETLVDARSAGRFRGEEPEPRPSKKAGHIPGSVNLPFTELVDDKKFFTFRDAETIAAAFKQAGLDIDAPMTISCGSGVTACVPALGLFLLGKEEVPVFDGSWAEWGDREDSPVA